MRCQWRTIGCRRCGSAADFSAASVGFYFTDRVPTNLPLKLGLTSLTMDIPPGESNYVVRDSFVLPVDGKFKDAALDAVKVRKGEYHVAV